MSPDGSSAFDLRRPFTRAAALAAGVEPRLLRGSTFRRIFRGVYVDASVEDTPALRAEAALALFPNSSAFASHATAGRIHGVPLPPLPEEHVTVLKAAERRDHAGIRVHVTKVATVVRRGGIRVSSCRQMFVELASLLNLVDLVVVGDDLVRRGKTTTAHLSAFCAASRHPAARAAGRAAKFVREDVDSPMESRLRMLLVLGGLPEPEVNLTLRTEDGVPLRRYDLSYPAVRVIVEYDGRHHIEREDQWEADLARREAIDDDGWRILVVTANSVYRRPEETLLRVWRLLRRRRLTGVPAVLSDAWRPHFSEPRLNAAVTTWAGARELTIPAGRGVSQPVQLPGFWRSDLGPGPDRQAEQAERRERALRDRAPQLLAARGDQHESRSQHRADPEDDQCDAGVTVAAHHGDAHGGADGEEQVVEALVERPRLHHGGVLGGQLERLATGGVEGQRLQPEDVDVHEGGEPGEDTGGGQHDRSLDE
jgi:very-short-patch-repair endonuclease